SLADMEKDLARFDALLSESADLKRLVKSPVFAADEQLRAISAVMEKAEIRGLVGNFVRVVAANHRLFAIAEIINAFRKLAADRRGEVAAQVTSAEPLNDRHLAALRDALKATIGKDVSLNTSVDPSLI